MIVQFIDEMKAVLDNILALKTKMTGDHSSNQLGDSLREDTKARVKNSADSIALTGTATLLRMKRVIFSISAEFGKGSSAL